MFRKCEFCSEKFLIPKYYAQKRFCSSKCRAQRIMPKERSRGHKPGNYKGKIIRKGYWAIHLPEHPFSGKQGYVKEHRLVMEKKLKRYLNPSEIVHHMNHNKLDNRPSNLMLLNTNAEHRALHKR